MCESSGWGSWSTEGPIVQLRGGAWPTLNPCPAHPRLNLNPKCISTQILNPCYSSVRFMFPPFFPRVLHCFGPVTELHGEACFSFNDKTNASNVLYFRDRADQTWGRFDAARDGLKTWTEPLLTFNIVLRQPSLRCVRHYAPVTHTTCALTSRHPEVPKCTGHNHQGALNRNVTFDWI